MTLFYKYIDDKNSNYTTIAKIIIILVLRVTISILNNFSFRISSHINLVHQMLIICNAI
jgi:hypothetical protein